MRKFVAFVLMLALCGFAWGCGGGETKKKTDQKPASTQPPEKKANEGGEAK